MRWSFATLFSTGVCVSTRHMTRNSRYSVCRTTMMDIENTVSTNVTVVYLSKSYAEISVESNLTFIVISLTLALIKHTDVSVVLTDYYSFRQLQFPTPPQDIERACIERDSTNYFSCVFFCQDSNPRVSKTIFAWGVNQDVVANVSSYYHVFITISIYILLRKSMVEYE